MSTYNTPQSNETAMYETADPIVEIRNAEVVFDMERGVSRVLDNANLDIERGEVLGIVGESGSGKSMLASSLLDAVVDPGILSGKITYRPEDRDPVDVLNLSDDELKQLRWEDISMVFQGAMSSFNPTMKVGGHFEETIRAHDYDMDASMERARELLADLYLEPERILESYPHELSGGMQQRALIALSLVLEPNVLVMDEPTAALDLLMQRSILSLLKKLKEKYDLTLVFITHDLPLVAELADRLAVMYAFELVEIGPTDAFLSDAGHPYTRALLNATPNLDAPLSEMRAIDGSAPDPVNVPEGCSYHPRCPLADDSCVAEDPDFEPMSDDHSVKCFHWEDAETAVPFSNRGDATPETDESDVVTTDTRRSDAEPLVSLNDVEVHFEESQGLLDFGDPEIVQAVDGVDLDITENDIVALVGESGCGKTTLGKTAIGIQRPTGGSVEYRGQDIWDAKDKNGDVNVPYGDIRRALQIIHQDPGSSLNPNRRVMKILEAPLKRWQAQMSTGDRREEVLSILERVGMTPPADYAGRYPHQLSGGEKQRVALVRALLMDPDVILADEAISALDVSLRVEMMDLMLEMQDQFDTSYVAVSHDLSNARYFAAHGGGQIGVMYLGQLVELGPAEKVINDPKHPYTKVLRWATPDLRADADTGEPPVRKIDIPDPKNPPSGCRFHTRCPEAREICRQKRPDPVDVDDDHNVSCFREDADHEYWSSPELTDDAPTSSD